MPSSTSSPGAIRDDPPRPGRAPPPRRLRHAGAARPVPDPQAYVASGAPVPNAVRLLLPRGVGAADVRLADNCYGYAFRGAIYPVLIPRGTQYCL